jgi:hypothetical protein
LVALRLANQVQRSPAIDFAAGFTARIRQPTLLVYSSSNYVLGLSQTKGRICVP